MKQERTKELDLHWSGRYYCNTCRLYTGQMNVHDGHDLVFIDNRRQPDQAESGSTWRERTEWVRKGLF